MASASFTRVSADYVRFKLTGGNTAYYYTFQHKSGNSWVSDVSNKTGKTSYSFDIYTGSAGVYCRIVQASRSGGSVTYLPSSSGQYVGPYVEQITINLKCGTGISSFDVSGGSAIRRITSSSYESFSVAKGTQLSLSKVQFKDGYSGIKWWYNSSASYNYPDASTTNPDYTLNTSYNRWGYFEATNYSPPSPSSYTLGVYDVYGGTTHYRDSYDLDAGYSFSASVYSSPPYGYEYNHAESPRGTRVTSVTMNADRSLYLFYTPIAPTTPSATITVTGRTENRLTVRANITNSLTHSDAWYLCISTTSSFSSYQSAQGSGSSVTHTFTGLAANTTYYFKVVNVYNEQQAWQSSYTTGTTRRAAFAWDHNDNLDNRRPTANEWSRLVSFIESVAGVTVSAAAKETIYVGGTLSHILFNELAQDVSLAQTASKGTRILKSVLNALRDKANTLR